MLLQDTLSDRAESAPAGAGLLARVHTRSRLIRRRRRVGAAGAGVAAVLLGVAGVPVVNGLLPGDGSGERFGDRAATKPVGSGDPATPAPERSDTTPSPPPPFNAVLGPPAFTMPKVPFTAPTAVIDGLVPAVPLFAGKPMIMHVPNGDRKGDPLLVLYIDPDPTTDPVQGDSTTVQVRGVSGKLVKITGQAQAETTLTWTESDGTPMMISAQNIPDDKVIGYANGLKRTESTVIAPFSFKELPQGLEVDNVSASDMVFKMPGQPSGGGFQYKLGFFLNADGGQDAASWPLKVGGRKAMVAPQEDGGKMLMISQPNGYVLSVQVPVNLKISDADLFRMAEGVTINGGARAGRG